MSYVDQKINDNYQKIKDKSSAGDVLEQLFSINRILFDPNFIDNLLELAAVKEYTTKHFTDIVQLLQASLFHDFSVEENENSLKAYEELFDIYFEAITKDRKISEIVTKIKICTLLKIKLTIPSYHSNLNIKNIVVTVSSAYKPKEIERVTAACDVSNIVKNSFFKAIQAAPISDFSYVPHSSSINIQGPILSMLITNELLLQDNLLQSAIACGVKVAPFINNSASNKLI